MSEVKELEEHEILKKIDPAPWKEVPLVLNNRSYKWVTDKICGIVESKPQLGGGGASSLLFVLQVLPEWDWFIWYQQVLVSGEITIP